MSDQREVPPVSPAVEEPGEVIAEMIERGASAIAGSPSCYCPDVQAGPTPDYCPAHGSGEWPEDRHRGTAEKVLRAALVGPPSQGRVFTESDVQVMLDRALMEANVRQDERAGRVARILAGSPSGKETPA